MRIEQREKNNNNNNYINSNGSSNICFILIEYYTLYVVSPALMYLIRRRYGTMLRIYSALCVELIEKPDILEAHQ